MFRDTLRKQFRNWWATRHEDFKKIFHDKETAFKAAQKRNENKAKDQQEDINADWLFHKKCICWEYLRFWLDDQSEKLRQKPDLQNDDRYRRAEFLKASTTRYSAW